MEKLDTPFEQIGCAQSVILLCLIRCFSIFSLSTMESDMENLSAKLFGIFLGFMIDLVFFIPTVIILKKNNGGIFELSKEVSNGFEKSLSVLYFLFALYSAVILAVQFNNFFVTTIYHGGEKIFFVIILCAVSLYGTKKGLEPCARAAAIFFIIILLTSFVGMFFLIPDIDFLNLSTPLFKGWKSVLRLAVFYASESFPICFLLAFGGKIKGGAKKAYLNYIIISLLILEVVSFLVITVLGEFGAAEAYSVFSLASASKGGILKRYDSFYMFSWIFTAIVKMTMLIYFSTTCLKPIFPKVKPATKSLFVAVLICVISYLFLENGKVFDIVLKLNSVGVFLVLTAIILPVATLLGIKIKTKRKVGGEAN